MQVEPGISEYVGTIILERTIASPDPSVPAPALVPDFDPAVTSYTARAPAFVDQVVITPDAAADLSIRVAGMVNGAGEAAEPIELPLAGAAVSVEVSGPGLTTTTYTVDLSRGRNVIDYVKASNTEVDDRFGFAVALDGDLLAISAPREDSAAFAAARSALEGTQP